MGSGLHSDDRAYARGMGYHDMAMDDLFEQNRIGTAHESMIPSVKENKAHLRESRDSENHPNSFPIILELDITASMGDIPDNLIRVGLPRMVSKLKELGVAHPQVLIIAVGDSIHDGNNGVFQLGQFESGDAEMDMWLKRIWISKGGGGNNGESYAWAYYYALNHIETDNWDKRKKKGVIWSIGDDHCHPVLTEQEMDEVMGYLSKGETVEAAKLVKALQEKWAIFHIDLGNCKKSWQTLLGDENVITNLGRRDYEGIADKIASISAKLAVSTPTSVSGDTNQSTDKLRL